MDLNTLLLALTLLFAAVAAGFCFSISRRLSRGGESGLARLLRDEFRTNRSEAAEASQRLRQEIIGSQKTLADSSEKRLDRMRETMDKQLKQMQDSNEKKLEQMRTTVDEKLQSTLEKRLGESFKQVKEQLEAVQRGVGEMRRIAADVGDLQRVLSGVKTSGTWAEYQLGDILEQILTKDQYEENVAPNPRSRETVEYAVKLPGKEGDSHIWLPIDAKFPQKDYQRLVAAREKADTKGVEESTAALVRSIRNAAKDIHKYIGPPRTTDFAIMFLPTEGLYAEIMQQRGLADELQQSHKVMVAGPATLSALLNSLRVGFRTLAIEKRSSEVRSILSAVKTEFGKFGGVLAKVKKQLAAASNTIDKTEVRTRAMQRKLQDVEALPGDGDDASDLLELPKPDAEK